MTLKVVKIGTGVQPSIQPQTDANSPINAAQASASGAAGIAASSVSSDAAVTQLRTANRSTSGEKIKDFKEAKAVAGEVAEQLRETAESGAHDLKNVSARDHLAN
ncbi:MAG: hypothetical protein KDD42_05315 [Bdellovibrionales bacterium]|nr:hypothetical protein [Bdellovibrionales bacterium]